MDKILELSVIELAKYIKEGRLSSEEVVSAYLDQIENNKDLNAVLYYDREKALSDAKVADERVKNGTARELEGVPIIVKDNISTYYYKTTCASKFLQNYVAPYEATVVKRLLDAGAVILGKANMD